MQSLILTKMAKLESHTTTSQPRDMGHHDESENEINHDEIGPTGGLILTYNTVRHREIGTG
jgi:hypothetical protein